MVDISTPRGRPFPKRASGNLAAGKPGSRNKLEENMLADFCAHWRQHGAEAIGRVYEKDPAEYVKLPVRLLPTQVAIDATAQQVVYHISARQLNPEEWIAKYGDAADEAVRARSIQSSVN